MADKILYSDIIAPDVQAQLDALTKTIKELTDELGQLRKATAKEDATTVEYNDTLRDSVELTDDLLRLIQDEIVLKKEVEKAQEKLKNTEKLSYEERNKLNAAVLKGKENLRAHGFVLRNAIKLNNSVKTSMTELSLELANNRMAYRKLSEEQRNNSKVGKVLLKTINRQDRAIKKLDAQIGNHQRNVGNYTSIVSSLSSTMSGLSPNIYKVSSAFRVYIGVLKLSKTTMAGMSKSAKALRIALISTGIGAIVVALGTLVGMLMNSSKFTDWFSEKLAYLGGVVDGVTNFLGKMGDALFLLFSGDFTGAWEAATDAVNGFSEGMDEATKAAERFYQAELKLTELTRNLVIQLSSLKIEENNLKAKIDDTTNSYKTRLYFAEQLHKNIIKQRELELNAAAALLENELSLEERQKANAEWSTASNNLLIARNRLAQDYIDLLIIEKFLGEDEEKFILTDDPNYLKWLANKEAKEKMAQDDATLMESIRANNLEEGIIIANANERDIARAKLIEQLEKQKLLAIISSSAALGQAFVALASAGSKSAEEQKQLAIASALINTFAGVGIAIGTYGPTPLGIIAAALALAAGLANVVKIQNTPVPIYATGTESVPQTGMALIHENERILPSHINKQLGSLPNDQVPGMINLGLKMPQLQSGISELVGLQRESNRIVSRWSYFDKNGNKFDLNGNVTYYN